MKLYPALTVEPDVTVAEFDARHPDGADYVIVPAMSRDDDPAALQWIKESGRRKARLVIGVCFGVKVVAAAGLLDNKRGTTHWFALKELREKHPSIQYVPNRRLVVDRGVVTTTGITASMPMSLTLIEAIAGRDKAEAVARDLGLDHWDARHASDAFKFTRPFAMTVMGNKVAFWNREELGVELSPGLDEVSLALVGGCVVQNLSLARSHVRRIARRDRDAQRHSHRSGRKRRRPKEDVVERVRGPRAGARAGRRRWPASNRATARARATSSPCSWSIRRT